MTYPNYQKLQKAVTEHLSEGNLDEICLSSESGEWSHKQLIEAVRTNRYEGIKSVNVLVKLSLDLVLRGKEKSYEFEIAPSRPRRMLSNVVSFSLRRGSFHSFDY